MTNRTHSFKFILVLIACVILLVVIFWHEVRRSLSIVTTTKNEPIVSLQSFSIPINQSAHLLGNPGAPLTLVIFADLSDAKARSLEQIITGFVSSHPKEARLVWYNFPKTTFFTNNHASLAKAALCADKQRLFWPFILKLLENKKNISAGGLNESAKTVGLNIDSWQECQTNTATMALLEMERTIAKQLGVNDAPTLFINNKKINLAEDFDLEQMLVGLITP